MFLETLQNAGVKASEKLTEETLGAREDYIGASDISSCPRKFVLNKLSNLNYDLTTLLNFSRGHIAEDVIDWRLENQQNYFKEFVAQALAETPYKVRQQEFVHPEYSFLRAHIDFLFHTANYSKISIVECKSTASLPDQPWESWIKQLQFQMGLTKLIYPNSDIKGIILAVDLSNNIVEFGPYEPNDTIFESLIQKGIDTWQIYQKLANNEENVDANNLPTEISLLCGYCPFKGSCPKFNGSELPDEVKDVIKNYIALSEQEKAIKEQKDGIRDQIISLLGTNVTKSFDGIKVSIKEQENSRIDTKELKNRYVDIYNELLKATKSVVLKIT
jgi:predicted phage-related endonuclease